MKKIPMYYKAANGKFCGSAGLTEVPDDSDLKYIILSKETGEEIGGVGRDGSRRAARKKTEVTTEATTEATTEVTEVTEVTVEVTTEATTMARATLNILQIPEAAPLQDGEENYYNDPYLMRLAADSTKCFSSWSNKDKSCRNCALRHSCRQSTLALFFESLKAEPVVEPVVEPAPEPVIEPAPEPAVSVSWKEDQLVAVPFSVICSGCGQTATAGTKMVKNPANKNNGMYHTHCC